MRRLEWTVAALAMSMSGAGQAHAQDLPVCPFGSNTLVIAGSPALEPVLRPLSVAFHAQTGTDIYYVRVAQCRGADIVLNAGLSGDVVHFVGDSKLHPDCQPPPFAFPDMWVGDSAIEDCIDGGKKPDGYRDFLGPIAAYDVVVPRASDQRAITVEEAYFVFGFGSPGWNKQMVTPWTDDKQFVIPGLDGAQILWAKFLHLPALPRPGEKTPPNLARAIKGGVYGGSPGGVITSMQDLITMDKDNHGKKAIGLTSAQAYDGGDSPRGMVKALAVQAWKQKRAFYADATSETFEKRNVREGRYPFWAPLHMVTKADATGRALKPRAEALINYLQMTVTLPDADVIAAIVGGHLVPNCAMKVTRAAANPDSGDLVPATLAPGAGCGCYMDELIQHGSSGCMSCDSTTRCPTGTSCSHGYCE